MVVGAVVAWEIPGDRVTGGAPEYDAETHAGRRCYAREHGAPNIQ
jgi:hypothetical protein